MSEPTLYEACYIIDTSLDEDEIQQLVEVVEEAAVEGGAEIVGTRDFRTRRLAYEINGHTHGTYKLLYFYGDGDAVQHLLSEMGIRMGIIRSRVFVANPHAIVGGVGGEDEDAVSAAEAAEEAEAEATTEEAAADTSVDVEAEEAAEVEEAPEAEEVVEAEEAEEAPEAEEAVEAEETSEVEEAPETEQ